jgi:hypothetical protein
VKTVFLQMIESDDKARALLAAIHVPETAQGRQRFVVDPVSFASVPRSPFAYWVSERLRQLFKNPPRFEAEGRFASVGASTKNDSRYLRLWFESPEGQTATSRAETYQKPWVLFLKGGAFSPFYADAHLTVNWFHDGRELKADISEYRGSRGWGYLWSAALNGHSYYFRPGLTWPIKNRFSLKPRPLPCGCIFAHVGPSVFVETDDRNQLEAILAVMSSSMFTSLARIMAGWNFEVGVIQRTPVPHLTAADEAALATLAHRAWLLKRSLDTRNETSHAFILPGLLQCESDTLADRATVWSQRVRNVEIELTNIQAGIDERCFDLYGINEADRRAISEGVFMNSESLGSDNPESDDASDDEPETSVVDAVSLSAELVSWATGVAFGRFDARLALEVSGLSLPAELDPFDSLPIFSTAMLVDDDGVPLKTAPAGCSCTFSVTGMLVDDTGHPDDLAATVSAVFNAVFGEASNARWNEAAANLDPNKHGLRGWFAKYFFDQHIKRYTKSRRKAPIYWELATPSHSYAVWLYYHRFTRDTFYKVLNDYAKPKLTHEEQKLARMRVEAGTSPTRGQVKDLEVQEKFVAELSSFREEVERIAPLWNPDLNDGVIINFAPLWRLAPQHKAWQKECKSCWDSLVAGDYDWAHLAMHLWPERVVPKCREDCSLAIAHGLEDVFWQQDSKGKWIAREDVTKAQIDALIVERTKPAVKAALESLLSAPAPGNGAKGKRKRKGG